MLRASILPENLLNQTETKQEASVSFWEKSLTDIEQLDLSFLRLKSPYNLLKCKQQFSELFLEETNGSGKIQFNFDEDTSIKLHKINNNFKIKPCLYAQSILAFLLNKYSTQVRFCLGYSSEIKNEEGYSCEQPVIVIPYDFSSIHDIVDIINQSREFLKPLMQEGVNHCDFSAPPISTPLNISLSNILFNHIYLHDNGFVLDNITSFANNYNTPTLSNGLSFEQVVGNKEINYRILYKSDKISPYLLSEFILCYKRLFVEILDNLLKKNLKKLTPNADYKLLSNEKYKEIIYTWNNTDKICVRNKTIPDIFEEQVKKTPNNTAIVYRETKLTYKELNERANSLANYLKQDYNLNPDALISLCLDRSEHMLIAILAVLKTGAAYVPINLDYPDERIKYILENTNTNLVLTNELHKKRLNEIVNTYALQVNVLPTSEKIKKLSIIEIDSISLQDQFLIQSKKNPDRYLIKGANLAYVIYTSGTTGKPKGVMIEHRSYIATMDCMKSLYFANEQEISTYNITNYAFDMIGPEYGLPLLSGGTVFIGNNEFDFLDCSKYDFIQMTPTLCDLKLDCLINTENTKLFLGAESVSQDLLLRVLNKSIDVVHLYGPTETTIWSTHKYYSSKDASNLLSVLLGKPFYNERFYVLDNSLCPLPIGATGELYIGGIGVARGYLNRPDLTAERFIPNPFQTIEEKVENKNTRLYKTGDLVRWLPDGNLEYIGRNDFQVKIRGYRIELGEIESSLSSYEGIKQSAVIAKERLNKDGSRSNHKYLVGYYVSDSQLDENRILSYLKSQLPDYMVPNFLIHLSNLPLSINGKLDRKALPAPEITDSNHYEQPRNEQEARLCNILAEVLGLPIDKVGILDDFFRLGGDSILAIRLVSKINQEFKSLLKVRDIYELSCISNLIKIINTPRVNYKEDESYVPFSLVKEKDRSKNNSNINLIEDIYPASYLQMRMLLESNNNKELYHIISNYSVHAKFEKNKLLTILKALTSKYELLRASFILNNDSGYNIIIFKSIDLEYHLYKDKNSKQLLANEKLNNFDYSRPGLFRIIVNDLGDKFDLIFSIHHAIEDGWSMAILVNEFAAAYINNKPIQPRLKLSYGEFVRNEIAAVRNQDNVDFWKKYLDGSNVAKVNRKSDKEKSENNLYKSFFSLNSEQVTLIHKISKELKISVDSIFLLIYLKTLSYFMEIPDVTVGVVANNRLEKEGGDKLFGLFINIIPFRFNLKNSPNDLNGLIEVFNNKVKLQKYKNMPYEYIRSLYNTNLYEFVFDFVHLHILSERVDGIESVDGYERTHMPFILTVVQKSEDAFILGINAHDDFISRDFLSDFEQHYKKCLAETSEIIQTEMNNTN